MPKTEEKAQISADMTISTILELHPKGAEIMQQFGLHCFGCSINVLETLEQGILGHGMPQSTLNELLDALNDDFENFKRDISEKGVYLTEKAALKIVEVAQMEGRTKYGIRLNMLGDGNCCSGPKYSMDFEETAEEGDKILGFHHAVTLFLDRDSFEKMKGSTIDYIVSYEAEGFKIDNPNVNTKSKCGCKGE